VGDVVKEGEPVECRVLTCDPDEQRLSLSIKALATRPTPAGAGAADEADEPEPEAVAPVTKKHTGPLKGGLGSQSDGARFGLNW
jgi:ribosomal protein S1